jgi:malonyl CoA-acyl carrier protein transacylase
MFYNQSAAILGNIIGGALVIGTFEHAMNHWESPLPWEKGHAIGTLAAHDVESSRKANEYRPQVEIEQMRQLARTRSRSVSQSVPRASNGILGMENRVVSV